MRGTQAVAVLRRLSAAFAPALDVEDVGRVVVEELLGSLGCYAGALATVHDDALHLQVARGWDQDYTRAYDVVPLSAALPLTQAVRDRAVVHLVDPEQAVRDYPALAQASLDPRSVTRLVLPLLAGDAVLGALALSYDHRHELDDEERDLLAAVADLCAGALVRAALVRERLEAAQARVSVLEELQHQLLRTPLPAGTQLAAQARYRHQGRADGVGGDWYDVVPLEGGRAVLVVGDVEGHDLEAAALMAQVRSAVRAYALEELPPSVVLTRADAFLAGLGTDRFVTVAVWQVDPVQGFALGACAGHWPPVLVDLVAGKAGLVDRPAGPPLGVPEPGRRVEELLWLPEHCRLVLYTDGLMSWRRGSPAADLDALVAEAAGARELELPAFTDTLLERVRDGSRDDVALLVVGMRRGATSGPVTQHLPADPVSVGVARRFLRLLLSDGVVGDDEADTAELLLSELVSNAVRNTEERVGVRVEVGPGRLRVEVSDTSHRMPVLRTDVPDEQTHGRGLRLIAATASRWGVDDHELGKTVWFELDL